MQTNTTKSIPESSILVIFGASGDLTHRKLLPALFGLYLQNLLPKKWAIIGVGRSSYSDVAYQDSIREDSLNIESYTANSDAFSAFVKNLYYAQIDTKNEDSYEQLRDKISLVQSENGIPPNIMFYLATPPNLYPIIPKALARFGLNKEHDGWKRLIIEKPFGTDLESAQTLNREIIPHFSEKQLFRIDHYLGKETVQNLLVFRFTNEIFEALWNRKYVEYVEITSAESLGIENRGGYYEQAGALRDMLQNHLLQLLAMVAMEPPAQVDANSVRNETYKVIQSLRPLTAPAEEVVLGQYSSATLGSQKINAYREENGVQEDSRTETYVGMRVFIDNWRWNGVPFYIRTGKRLPTRITEIVIHFRHIPTPLFRPDEAQNHANQLIIRIQPNEGIQLKFGMKKPGSGFEVKKVNMDFLYSDLSNTHIPEAYERLLLDAWLGDATLYARGDFVERCWEYVKPLLQWKENGAELFSYPAGTWGPIEADELLARCNYKWRKPCKNLTNDGSYCEL